MQKRGIDTVFLVAGTIISAASTLPPLFGVNPFGMLEKHSLAAAGLSLFLGGFLIGWFAKAKFESASDRRREEKAAREAREAADAARRQADDTFRMRFESLTAEQRAMLDSIYVHGMAKVPQGSSEDGLCEGLSHLGFTAFEGGGLDHWWTLTDRCRALYDRGR